MSSEINFSKKAEGAELCFNEDAFIHKTFSIDKFLRDHRNTATLEVLRDDLGTYLKKLRLSMIDLINKDYEDFVNLSKDLIGLNNGIEALESPLQQIKAEVMLVKSNLEETILGLIDCLNHDRSVKEKKQCLQHLSQGLSSIMKLKKLLERDTRSREGTLDVMERSGAEYCIMVFSVNKCRTLLSAEQKEDIECISKLLLNMASNTLLECLCDRDALQLARCIRLFVSMDKVSDLEKLIREEVVAPFLQSAVREALKQGESAGLRSLYDSILAFNDTQLLPIIAACEEHGPGRINVIARCLWSDLERRLELDMPYIFSAGDPDAFRVRYSDTMAFLEGLQGRTGSLEASRALMTHPQTIRFQLKWNLLVYFKIRFQEIAAEMECGINLRESASTVDKYHLHVPAITNICIHRCWDEHVFLPSLAHLFWKLSLQLLARYCVWVKEEAPKDQEFSSGQESSRMKFLINVYVDTGTLADDAVEFLSSQAMSKNMVTALSESAEQIKAAQALLASSVVTILVQECLVPLAHVKDIPRLFRRTNRETPNKPSDYVNTILQIPTEFFINNRELLSPSVLHDLMKSVLCDVTGHFYTCVNEVLTNAQKTEESLRRLKKAKDRSTGSGPTDFKSSSDDDKIRQQLVLDVERWCQGSEELSVRKGHIAHMTDLLDLVNSAWQQAERS